MLKVLICESATLKPRLLRGNSFSCPRCNKIIFYSGGYVWQVFDIVAWKVLEVVINDSQLKIVTCSVYDLPF